MVESKVGEGTTFTLYLPRAGIDTVRAPATPAPAMDAASRQRVMLVEDNETVGSFAQSLLGELGQDVTWVSDADEALRAIAERNGMFDLVFSDVVMPGMNGIELAQTVRRRWPKLAVVLTSGYSHILAEEGSHGFELLQKPYSVEALLGVLNRNANRRR